MKGNWKKGVKTIAMVGNAENISDSRAFFLIIAREFGFFFDLDGFEVIKWKNWGFDAIFLSPFLGKHSNLYWDYASNHDFELISC